MLSIKSRSIDVGRDPIIIFTEQTEILRKNGLEIIEFIELDPYEKDHALVVVKLP